MNKELSLQIENLFNVVYLISEPFRRQECGFRMTVFNARLFRELVLIIVFSHIDLLNDFVFEPCHSFALFPDAKFDFLFLWIFENAKSVLLAFVPPAFIFSAIRPIVESIARFLIINILALIGHTVRVNINTMTMHVVIFPIAEILTAILPFVLSNAIDLIIVPVA